MNAEIFSPQFRKRLLVLLVLAGVIGMGLSLLGLYQTMKDMREHENRTEAALQAIQELGHTTRMLTLVAREGAITARPETVGEFQALQNIRAGRVPRSTHAPAASGRRVSYVHLLNELGVDEAEGRRLREALTRAEALAAAELKALETALSLGTEKMSHASAHPEAESALNVLFGKEHKDEIEHIQRVVNSVASSFANRMGAQEDVLEHRIVLLLIAIVVIFFLTTLGGIGLSRMRTGRHTQDRVALLYLGTLLALMLSLGVPIWLVYVDARTLMTEALEQRQTAICQEVYRELQLRSAQVRNEAQVLANIPAVRTFLRERDEGNAAPDNITDILQRVAQNYMDVSHALLYDRQGNALASTRSDIPLSRQQIPHAGLMARVLRGESFLSVGEGPFIRQQQIMALAPAYGSEDGRGPVLGAVMLVIDKERGFRLWESRMSAEERMNIYVVDSTGASVLSSRGSDQLGQRTTAMQALDIIRKGGEGLHYYEDRQGALRLGVFMPMPDVGWTVAVTSAYVSMTSKVSGMLVRALISGVTAVLLTIVVFSLLMQRMTRRLRRVNDSLNNLISNAGVHRWAFDMAQGSFSYTPSWHRCMRMPGAPQAGVCTWQEWQNRVHPEDMATLACLQAKNAQGTYLKFEARYRDWEDGWHWFRVQACVEECDMEQRPLHISAMALEITAQRTVEQSAAELQTANELLEEVINTAEMYTIDYDLTQPTFKHNAQWCRFWRWPGKAEAGEKLFAVILARFAPLSQKNFQTMFEYAAVGDTFSMEMQVRTWDDVWRWCRLSGRIEKNERDDGLRLIGTGFDISAQKKLEQSEAEQRQLAQNLQMTNARLDELLTVANMFTYDLDLVSGLFEHNAQWCRFWNYPGEPEAGVKPLTFLTERVDAPSLERMNEVLATAKIGDAFDVDLKVTICSGEERWCRHFGRIIAVDGNGKAIHAVGTGHDVTAEKNVKLSEAALSAANERMRSVIESADMFTYELNLQTQEMTHSAQWCHFWHYPGPAEAGVKPLSFVLERLFPGSEEAFFEAISGKGLGDIFSVDIQMTICTGETRWGRRAGRVESVDENGQPLRIIGTGHDITAWKIMQQSETALRELSEELASANAQMDAMVEAGELITFDLDLRAGVFHHNAQWCRFWEYPGPAKAGIKPFSFYLEHLHPDSRAELRAMFVGKKLGEKFSIEIQITTCTNEIRWARQVGRIEEVDEDGKILRVIGTAFDITAQKRMQRSDEEYKVHLEQMVAYRTAELEENRNQAQAASQAKTVFLSTVSHEIRTPMNAIMGFTHLFDRSNLTEEQKEQLSKIRLAASTLLGIINDVLDISKIEAGKLELEERPFDLQTLMDTVHSIVDFAAFDKGLTLRVILADDVPRELVGDTQRISQVLLNLLNNAVKFTKKGRVQVTVSLKEPADAQGRVLLGFRVEDTGVGIAPEHLGKLFQPFMQADSSVTRRFGGTGLGLAISRQLVELMGGEIHVASELGVGSTFHVTLRLLVARGEEAMELSAQRDNEANDALPADLRMAGHRILVVEDNEINQEIALALLEEYGFEVDMANDGQVAQDMTSIAAYDCIFMDMQMPVMDGLEAARQLRARGNRAREEGDAEHAWLASVPIIAMTANAMAEDRQRCLDAGMNDHIGKPVEPAALRKILRRWLGDEAAEHGEEAED